MSKPRIVVDARMAGPVGHGIGLYVQQMAIGLSRLNLPYEVFYLLAPDAPADSPLRSLPHAVTTVPFLSKKEPFRLAPEIRQFAPALYHSPSFSSLLRYPCPHIQTVHDLNHLQFGSRAQKLYYRFVLLRSLSGASRVLSVSETSALELREWMLHHGVDQMVEVAPNAIEPFPVENDSAVLRRFGLETGNYFFALSNPKPHKNLPLLERAYLRARSKRSMPLLALSIHGRSENGVVRTGPLAGAEVGALLRNAKTFYFPSLYEGFGRPPLEAALAGTVPVVSSLSVHREVLAGVSEAQFLDPAAESRWEESFLRQANCSDRVSESSKDWIRTTWSVARLAAAMDHAYRECLP
ncbi:MAG: glycosyltransferase family 4 protein [Bdellovibrionota bacterium]